ncbi:MAG: hypothetical protein NZ765_07620 [Anaerolineae bacterium]|nr:hypothetical protein [Anaerolineae bacterium]MDW8071487.1 hypothetical protein [Anaerolineae bacterium]
MNETQRILLGWLLIFIALLVVGRQRAGRWLPAEWRTILAFERLHDAVRRAVEQGRALHITLGRGGLWSGMAMDSLASVEVLMPVTKLLSWTGQMPLVTSGDATLHLLAEDQVHRVRRSQAIGLSQAKPDVRWLTATPAVYAAGVMGILAREPVEVNVMAGFFGAEYLLMGEAGVQRVGTQLGGASELSTLPFVVATSRAALLGEELYAAGAYLAHKPWHLGSLWAQDGLRWLIMLGILAGVIVNTLL